MNIGNHVTALTLRCRDSVESASWSVLYVDRGYLFLYFAINPWNTIRQRPQQIARLLSRVHDVVYVNPVLDPIAIPLYRVWRRNCPASISPIARVYKKDATLHILDPPTLIPGVLFLGVLNDLAVRLLSASAVSYAKASCKGSRVLWLSHPRQAKVLDAVGSKWLICYDCMDDYANLEFPARREYYDSNERRILERADVVFCTSKALEEKCRRHAANVLRVPNGAEISHFRPKKRLNSIPFHKKQPVIGFYGYIGHWFDVDLVFYAASKHQDWVFRIIGPEFGSRCDALRLLANVELLGEISYESLPQYVDEFDVCMIPFTTGNVTDTVNPVKLYEYLATGKPIVSTDLSEVAQFEPYVRIAKNQPEFVEWLEDALKEDDEALKAERMRIAEQNSWEERVRTILQAIDNARAAML